MPQVLYSYNKPFYFKDLFAPGPVFRGQRLSDFILGIKPYRLKTVSVLYSRSTPLSPLQTQEITGPGSSIPDPGNLPDRSLRASAESGLFCDPEPQRPRKVAWRTRSAVSGVLRKAYQGGGPGRRSGPAWGQLACSSPEPAPRLSNNRVRNAGTEGTYLA